MSQRTVVIVQARTSSSRLPGKVLMPLGGRPSLVRIIERLRLAHSVAEVVVATSTSHTDDPLAQLCARTEIPCHRGSLDDVLDRFHGAAAAFRADTIVRVTGDCPLHEGAVVDRCVNLFVAESAHVDYVSNVDERTFPDGLDGAIDAGAAAVIQPGGSIRDDEVIAAADEHGLAMVFTGERHFRH